MANVIKHKRGSGSDPVANDLVVGEVAIRTDTGKLFTKMDNGSIAEIAGGGSDIAINTLSSSSATGGGSATFNGSAYRFTLSAPPSVSAAQLLVSINGVIQKPVPGTGQPSEGFSVDGTDIILGDAPATGSDFFILTFKSLGVSEPADNSVTSAKIVDGAIVNADINASAAIAGTKISPDFGSQNITTSGEIEITGSNTILKFTESDANPDFGFLGNAGSLRIQDMTNTNNLFIFEQNRVRSIMNFDAEGGLDVTGGGLTVNTGTTNTCATFISTDAGAVINLTDNSARSSIEQNGTDLKIISDTDGGDADSTIKLQVDASTKMLINSSGNVGIGTTGPNAKLEIASNHSQLRLKDTDDNKFCLFSYSGGKLITRNNSTSTTTAQFTLDESGRLGIGTISPGFKLDILEPTNTRALKIQYGDSTNNTSGVEIQNSTAAGKLFLGVWGPSTNAYGQVNANDAFLGTNEDLSIHSISNSGVIKFGIGASGPTERMRIKSDGDVLLTRATAGGGGNETLLISANYGSGSDQAIQASNNLRFYTGGNNERIRIDTSGQVGINTTDIRSDLHVCTAGSSEEDGTLRVGGSDSSLGLTFTYDQSSHTTSKIYANPTYTNTGSILHIGVDGDANPNQLVLKGDGNVGIGLSDPDQELEVAGVVAANDLMVGRAADRHPIIQRHTASSGSQSLTITAGAGLSTNTGSSPTINDSVKGAAIQLSGGDPATGVFSGGIKYIANGHTNPNNPGTGNQHVFYTRSGVNTSTERMRIEENGSVFIGTTTGGNIGSYFQADNNDRRTLNVASSSSAAQNQIIFRNPNDRVGSIQTSGTSTSYNTTFSDIASKKNFEDWNEDVLSLFKSVNPQKFNFKVEDDSASKSKGFIAQEMVNKFPEAYVKQEDEMYMFNPSGMVVYLMKALQEAVARIETLEAK